MLGLPTEEADVSARRLALFRRWSRRLSLWLPVTFAVLIVVARVDGYQMHVVRSGSMTPTLHVGDVTIGRTVAARSIRRGDIVTFREPAMRNALVTHRVLTVTPQGDQLKVVTKGDANKAWETWTVRQDSSVESTPYSIPYLGRVTTDRWAGLAFGLALVALAAWLAIAMIRGTYRRREGKHAQLLSVPPRLYRMHWLATGWIAFGAVVLMVTTPAYSAWTATDTNAQTLNTSSVFPIIYTPSPANCASMTQQTQTITAGQTLATVTVKGADGGDGNGAGGNGGVIVGTFAVSSGQVLYIDVGCAGTGGNNVAGGVGWANGGTSGQETTGNAGSGGGASAICIATCATLANIQFIGGGGGGGGGGASGGGTGGVGSSATTAATTTTVGTAYDGVGGSGGTSPGAGGAGGVFNAVGTGGNGTNHPCCYGDGGGGGGAGAKPGVGGGAAYFGGGGGGGGGSSWYKSGVTFTSQTTNGSGNGSIKVTIT